MPFYHGTDKELICLKQGSYVSKSFKDSCKFGYRRAVLSGNHFVYVYSINIDIQKEKEFLEKDQKRDRAFVTLIPIKVELKAKYSTYQTPYKLKKFKLRGL